jgi:dipeptidyl aminopeptidase/acylaminoacyl peptidase
MKGLFLKKTLQLTGIVTIPVLIISTNLKAQENLNYKTPPKEITNIIENSKNNTVLISGRGNFMAIMEEPTYPTIKEISKPILKLAGLRIDPNNNGNIKSSYYQNLRIKNLNNSKELPIHGLPENALISDVSFSPNEDHIGFTISTENEIQLWIASLNSLEARRLTHFALNDVYGTVYQWAPNGETILANFILDNRKLPPKKDETPKGPIVMENLGTRTPGRTYQDLLKNPYDEALLDYYLISQLKMVYLNGESVNFSRPGIYKNFDFSPDGNVIMVSAIQKPYSYHVPIQYFPYNINILDKYGKLVKKLADIPIADNLPTGFDAVTRGARAFQWRTDKPQTYIWVEAQDLGDPAVRILVRDIIYMQEVNDNSRPTKLAECYLRFNSIIWGDDQIALLTEKWWKTRSERRVFIKPGNPSYRVNLWDRYYEDAYSDPGKFVTTKNEYNKDVLLLEYNSIKRIADPNNVNIFSISEGSSPSGDRPFVLKFNVKTKLTDTLFRSKAPFYEKPIFFENKEKLIVRKESFIENPNYYAVDLNRRSYHQLTFFQNTNPELFGIEKKQINYKRADQLNLTANLYLPKNYNISQGRLPVLMWAYPREYKTSSSAGQVKGSPYQYPKISWSSPVFWVTQGFAVLDNVDMPIVGESNEQPNDTFVEQLKENAVAAIDKLNELGIADRKRIAIGGHSYGAFMTANLLAHTNLFAAGIARSGAYNRTLTPFGFQAEERTYWENPDVYFKMSPFSYADRIKTPLLLIHGENDDNSGTFTLQSERLYTALKGNGATTRLVLLPSEAHSFKAKESILHMLWEMDTWLKTYVKDSSKNPSTASNK